MITSRPCLRWLLAMLAFTVAPLHAGTFVITDDELDAELFPAVAESIRVNLDKVPRSRFSRANRKVVLRSLERMEHFFAEDPQRHDWRIRQEQRRVNSALLPAVAPDRSGAQVVCRRVKDVGSHIHKTECRSRQEIEAEREAAQRIMLQPVLPTRIKCGGIRANPSC